MELVAWITLFVALVGGYACLRSCRAILQSPTIGVQQQAVDGLIRMALSGRLSSRECGLLASSVFRESARIRVQSTQPARFRGWSIEGAPR